MILNAWAASELWCPGRRFGGARVPRARCRRHARRAHGVVPRPGRGGHRARRPVSHALVPRLRGRGELPGLGPRRSARSLPHRAARRGLLGRLGRKPPGVPDVGRSSAAVGEPVRPPDGRTVRRHGTFRAPASAPGSLGLDFTAVRADALDATSHGVDFGQLFLGLGFFLVAAALVLTVLLSLLSVDQRAGDIETLAALGWTRGRIRALGRSRKRGHRTRGRCHRRTPRRGLPPGDPRRAPHRVARRGADTGAASAHRAGVARRGVCRAGSSCRSRSSCLPPRRVLRRAARSRRPRSRSHGAGAAVAAVTLGGAAAAFFLLPQPTGFFASGALLLVGLLAGGALLLTLAGRPRETGLPTLAGIGAADAARRRTRSLGVASLLACGIFIVTAVAANRIVVVDPGR